MKLKLFALLAVMLAGVFAAEAKVTEVSGTGLQKIIANPERVVVIDCYADWCGPCRMYGPIFQEVSNKGLKADFYRIDVDRYASYLPVAVEAIPTTLVLYRDPRGELHYLSEMGLLDAAKLTSLVKRGIRLHK